MNKKKRLFTCCCCCKCCCFRTTIAPSGWQLWPVLGPRTEVGDSPPSPDGHCRRAKSRIYLTDSARRNQDRSRRQSKRKIVIFRIHLVIRHFSTILPSRAEVSPAEKWDRSWRDGRFGRICPDPGRSGTVAWSWPKTLMRPKGQKIQRK